MKVEEKINIFKKTRKIATESFYDALQNELNTNEQVSEAQLRNAWLDSMRESGQILEDGWYQPPPHGMAVLFAKDTDGVQSRLNFTSLRVQENWPRDDVFLDIGSGLISVYASPVDKRTGIIGDFGLTLYLGSDKDIQNHLRATYKLTNKIADYMQIGMTFAEVTKYAHGLMQDNGFVNEVECTTEPSLGDNVGHTIPAVYESWTQEEQAVIDVGDMEQMKDVISNNRIYLSSNEDTKIAPGMAITVEPRPTISSNSKIPMGFYHTVCIFHENGEKEFVTEFGKIFRLASMDYMF